FVAARDLGQMEAAVRSTFERLGDTPFALDELIWKNPAAAFVPISRLNALRRDLVCDLERALAQARAAWVERIQAACVVQAARRHEKVGRRDGQARRLPYEAFHWSIKVDRASYLDAFENEDWRDLDEVVIDIARDHPATLRENLAALGDKVGRERIRLALPALTRAWEDHAIRHKIDSL